MKPTYTETDSGITVSVKRMEKVIRAADGTMRKLVSFDGEHWRMDAAAEKRRIQSATNLHGKKWLKKQEKKFFISNNQGVAEDRPVILPVTHHGNPFLGKEKGKKHHLRRNLRRKKEKDVKLLRPVHRHTCHGEMHGGRREAKFSCCCDQPKKRRYCGGTFCLYDMKGVLT